MKVHRVSGLILACACFGWAADALSAPADDELLVLGLRLSDGSLCTVLADKDGVRRAGDGLAIPRADGFWKGVMLDRKEKATRERVFFAAPAGSAASPPPLEAEENCESETAQTVLFVGPDFVAVEESAGGYCEGAAHPYASVGLKTFAIGTEIRPKALSVEAVFGKAALDVFEKTAEKAHGGEAKREEDCLRGAGPEDFGLVRIQGRWALRGALGYAAEVCRGNHEYFTVPFEPPAKVTGQTRLRKPFAALAKEHPGLLDAVVSPSGDILVLLKKTGVEVIAGGKSAGSMEIEGPSAVMTQWALGKSAARWRQEVPQVLVK